MSLSSFFNNVNDTRELNVYSQSSQLHLLRSFDKTMHPPDHNLQGLMDTMSF